MADKREAALRVAQGHQDACDAVDTAKKNLEESMSTPREAARGQARRRHLGSRG